MCYSPRALKQIAATVTAYRVCSAELLEYQRFHKEDLTPTQPTAFYQEPSFIIGGMVLTLGLGVFLGSLLVKK